MRAELKICVFVIQEIAQKSTGRLNGGKVTWRESSLKCTLPRDGGKSMGVPECVIWL